MIVVGPAAATLKTYHHRMPIVIDKPNHEAWLAKDTDPADAFDLVRHPYSGPFEVREVCRRVNSPQDDEPGLVDAA